jgi:hypothetical protein
MSRRLDGWMRFTLVCAAAFVVFLLALRMARVDAHASALAGTEPASFAAVFGLLYVVVRLATLIAAPIGVLAVVLSWVSSWLSRRFAPSPPDDG